MSFIDRALEQFAPVRALRRAEARAALSVLKSSTARYDAARPSNRNSSLRAVQTDADGAALGQRQRLAAIAQDMMRNTPLAARAQSVIASAVVGDGIIPAVKGGSKREREALLRAIERHCDSTDIDADGRGNLYALQELALKSVIADGEVLIRRRARTQADGLALPFQLQLLEAAHLDGSRDADLPGGAYIREGIQFSPIGKREGYWLFPVHPAASGVFADPESRFVPASEVIHLYRIDRPGQRRGVSWFANVAQRLVDLADYQDAQIMRQKIASCFSIFTTNLNGEVLEGEADPMGLETIAPGRVQRLSAGEDIKFASPPGVDGYTDFTKGILREVAAGLGITYEALSGDLTDVNFSSARIGAVHMNRNITGLQWKLMVPVMMNTIGRWLVEEFFLQVMRKPSDLHLDWVPPALTLTDPVREIPMMRDAIRAGLMSRSNAVRMLGYDPERLLDEQAKDQTDADDRDLRFSSDARIPAKAPVVVDDPDEAPETPDPEEAE